MGAPSQVDTSIHALIGNSVDSGAAPYSASAAYSLATTSDSVSVSDTQATTLPGTARSTLMATTLPWAATIRILARRINAVLLLNRSTVNTLRAMRWECPETGGVRVVPGIVSSVSASAAKVPIDGDRRGAPGAGTVRHDGGR